MVRRRGGQAKSGPKKKRKPFRVIDGMRYIFDRTYTTLKGAQRRVKNSHRVFTKQGPSVWYTWSSTGRDASGKRVKTY